MKAVEKHTTQWAMGCEEFTEGRGTARTLKQTSHETAQSFAVFQKS
jgi:hypothetical protein